MTRAYRDASEPEGSMTNPSEAMIEKVARAMSDAVNAGKSPIVQWDRLHREERELYETAARASIAAMQAATPAAPVQITPEWCLNMAELEKGHEVGAGVAALDPTYDCPHAAPHRYCETCKVSPCPIGLGRSAAAPVQDDDAELAAKTLRALLAYSDGAWFCMEPVIREAIETVTARLTPDRVTPLVEALRIAEYRVALARITEHYPPDTIAGRLAADVLAKYPNRFENADRENDCEPFPVPEIAGLRRA